MRNNRRTLIIQASNLTDNSKYVKFEDKAVEARLMTIGCGDGVGITMEDLQTFKMDDSTKHFKNITGVTKFNELRYMVNTPALPLFNGSSLEEVTAPEISNISNMFYNAKSLAKITIPKTVTNFDWQPFGNTPEKDFYYEGDSVVDWMYIPLTTNNCWVEWGGRNRLFIKGELIQGTIDLSSSNKTSTPYAARRLKLMSKLILPETVKQMNAGTQILDNPDLVEIQGLKNLHTLISHAFNNNPLLEKIDIGDITTTTVTDNAFTNCYKLVHEISFPNATSGGYQTFMNASSLVKLNLPNYKTLEQQTFANCSSLKEVILPSEIVLNKQTFRGCTSLESLGHDEVTFLGTAVPEYAFYSCTNLTTTLKCPNATTLNDCAFYNCKSLKRIELPEVIENCSTGLFRYCNALESLGRDVIKILKVPSWLFGDCYNLDITLDVSKVTEIGEGAFHGANKMKFTSWDSLTSVVSSNYGHNFQSCKAMTNFIAPHLIKLTGSSQWSTDYRATFGGCTSLEYVYFEDITLIYDYNFYNCPALTSLVINSSTPPSINKNLLYGAGNCYIYVPDDAVETYKTYDTIWATYTSKIKPISECPNLHLTL